jgi:hypothetical protein
METIAAPPAQDQLVPLVESKQCFKALMEHWAKARIDGPMQAVARYDDASKQLVTIGSLMQGLLVAAYSLMGKQQGIGTSTWQLVLIVSFMIFLILFFVCAAGVCWTQPKMDASEVHGFLLRTLNDCFTEKDLGGVVRNWCVDIDGIRRRKRRWLTLESIFFMLCSVTMTGLLMSPFIFFHR